MLARLAPYQCLEPSSSLSYPSSVVLVVFYVIPAITPASAVTVREVGSIQKMTEIDIEGEGVEGCHDTHDFILKNLKHSAISKNI